ncbi:MAG: alpha/beta fold hydrolase [Candidatus Falkowbacteria bacterium]|nr:alpha/beta fold hydrolase [Candidatus Falkowbacteria bacterium]
MKIKTDKLFIKNRKNQNVCVLVEIPAKPAGLAFVMHGLGGFKEKSTTATQARALLDNNYITVRFDTTNTLGESDGDFSEATTTNYYEDLEDVIDWAAKQDWYQEPFILCGHSLGGICVALYAEKFPEKIKALASLATTISGKLLFASRDPKDLAEWKKAGSKIYVSRAKPGVVKNFKWDFMEDILKYDILERADKLTMPVLLIVGELDRSETLANQQLLLAHLPGEAKELHVIKDAPHTWREPKHLEESYNIISQWLKSIR